MLEVHVQSCERARGEAMSTLHTTVRVRVWTRTVDVAVDGNSLPD